ncbi:MAG: helix-turn-helix transcriptional regulator [Bacteroidetes bacterium]|nr:helix-turn-helix transcriptional regulator [Bacteroidota bacterium]
MINVKELGKHVTRKREAGHLSLRAVAKLTGVSPSTLSRIETAKGFIPDATTLAKLCRWLEIPIERIVGLADSLWTERSQMVVHYPNEPTPSIVEAYLRADPELTPETAYALSELFRIAYEGYRRNVGNSSRQNEGIREKRDSNS